MVYRVSVAKLTAKDSNGMTVKTWHRYLRFCLSLGELPSYAAPVVDGKTLFYLHDTMGLNPDMVEWYLKEQARKSVRNGLQTFLNKHRKSNGEIDGEAKEKLAYIRFCTSGSASLSGKQS